MASWHDVEEAAPELAGQVRGLFDRHVHKTIATLRADGSPRISGTEVQFRDGELWIGSMLDSRKAQDLRRDPRFALHSGSDDPPEWHADARVSGRMVEVTDPDRVVEINGTEVGPSHLFRADISELMVVRRSDAEQKLIIESWREGVGLVRRER